MITIAEAHRRLEKRRFRSAMRRELAYGHYGHALRYWWKAVLA